MSDALPRVTYSNLGVDLTPVHDHLDAEIPRFKARLLGRHWPNVIGGAHDDDGERYGVTTPIDRASAIGSFVAAIPAPLGIGKVELDDGRWLCGFICDGFGLAGAENISRYGGWRNWLAAH